jgi:DHA2 family multidrug resistance protein-like MFS transporter
VETAKALGGTADPSWLEPAKQGFSTGFAACCLLASVILLLLAVIARKVYAKAHIDESAVGSH